MIEWFLGGLGGENKTKIKNTTDILNEAINNISNKVLNSNKESVSATQEMELSCPNEVVLQAMAYCAQSPTYDNPNCNMCSATDVLQEMSISINMKNVDNNVIANEIKEKIDKELENEVTNIKGSGPLTKTTTDIENIKKMKNSIVNNFDNNMVNESIRDFKFNQKMTSENQRLLRVNQKFVSTIISEKITSNTLNNDGEFAELVKAADKLINKETGIVQDIGTAAKDVLDSAGKTATDLADTAGKTATDLADTAGETATDLADTAGKTATDLADTAGKTATGLVDGVFEGANKIFGTVMGGFVIYIVLFIIVVFLLLKSGILCMIPFPPLMLMLTANGYCFSGDDDKKDDDEVKNRRRRKQEIDDQDNYSNEQKNQRSQSVYVEPYPQIQESFQQYDQSNQPQQYDQSQYNQRPQSDRSVYVEPYPQIQESSQQYDQPQQYDQNLPQLNIRSPYVGNQMMNRAPTMARRNMSQYIRPKMNRPQFV